jgi:hypothetical protein
MRGQQELRVNERGAPDKAGKYKPIEAAMRRTVARFHHDADKMTLLERRLTMLEWVRNSCGCDSLLHGPIQFIYSIYTAHIK